jgi:hypothetical protein
MGISSADFILEDASRFFLSNAIDCSLCEISNIQIKLSLTLLILLGLTVNVRGFLIAVNLIILSMFDDKKRRIKGCYQHLGSCIPFCASVHPSAYPLTYPDLYSELPWFTLSSNPWPFKPRKSRCASTYP